jgi:hypothetical protein
VSVAEQFRKARVVFQPSQRKFKAGSIMILRDYLKITNGNCRLKIMNNCAYTIQTLPLLRVDKGNVEQYDTHGPDHAADMLCYALRKNIKTKEELASYHGVSARNLKALRRMGAYGAR